MHFPAFTLCLQIYLMVMSPAWSFMPGYIAPIFACSCPSSSWIPTVYKQFPHTSHWYKWFFFFSGSTDMEPVKVISEVKNSSGYPSGGGERWTLPVKQPSRMHQAWLVTGCFAQLALVSLSDKTTSLKSVLNIQKFSFLSFVFFWEKRHLRTRAARVRVILANRSSMKSCSSWKINHKHSFINLLYQRLLAIIF